MRRYPNPVFFLPVLIASAIGGALGWLIVATSCRTCTSWLWSVGTMGALLAGGGMAVVMVLVIRSMDEHKAAQAAGRAPSAPECEVPKV